MQGSSDTLSVKLEALPVYGTVRDFHEQMSMYTLDWDASGFARDEGHRVVKSDIDYIGVKEKVVFKQTFLMHQPQPLDPLFESWKTVYINKRLIFDKSRCTSKKLEVPFSSMGHVFSIELNHVNPPLRERLKQYLFFTRPGSIYAPVSYFMEEVLQAYDKVSGRPPMLSRQWDPSQHGQYFMFLEQQMPKFRSIAKSVLLRRLKQECLRSELSQMVWDSKLEALKNEGEELTDLATKIGPIDEGMIGEELEEYVQQDYDEFDNPLYTLDERIMVWSQELSHLELNRVMCTFLRKVQTQFTVSLGEKISTVEHLNMVWRDVFDRNLHMTRKSIVKLHLSSREYFVPSTSNVASDEVFHCGLWTDRWAEELAFEASVGEETVPGVLIPKYGGLAFGRQDFMDETVHFNVTSCTDINNMNRRNSMQFYSLFGSLNQLSGYEALNLNKRPPAIQALTTGIARSLPQNLKSPLVQLQLGRKFIVYHQLHSHLTAPGTNFLRPLVDHRMIAAFCVPPSMHTNHTRAAILSLIPFIPNDDPLRPLSQALGTLERQAGALTMVRPVSGSQQVTLDHLWNRRLPDLDFDDEQPDRAFSNMFLDKLDNIRLQLKCLLCLDQPGPGTRTESSLNITVDNAPASFGKVTSSHMHKLVQYCLSYAADNMPVATDWIAVSGPQLYRYLVMSLLWYQTQLQAAAIVTKKAWDRGDNNFCLPRSCILALLCFGAMTSRLFTATPNSMSKSFRIPLTTLASGMFYNIQQFQHPFNLDCFKQWNDGPYQGLWYLDLESFVAGRCPSFDAATWNSLPEYKLACSALSAQNLPKSQRNKLKDCFRPLLTVSAAQRHSINRFLLSGRLFEQNNVLSAIERQYQNSPQGLAATLMELFAQEAIAFCSNDATCATARATKTGERVKGFVQLINTPEFRNSPKSIFKFSFWEKLDVLPSSSYSYKDMADIAVQMCTKSTAWKKTRAYQFFSDKSKQFPALDWQEAIRTYFEATMEQFVCFPILKVKHDQPFRSPVGYWRSKLIH